MKKIVLSLMAVAALSACNSGGSSNNTTDTTPYNLQNYKLTNNGGTNNCTVNNNSTINCDSTGVFGSQFTVTFNTTGNTPGAYVVMPPAGTDEAGLSIEATSAGCSQTAPATGDTYTCVFTIGADHNAAKKGQSVNIYVNGTLGQAKIITVNVT